MTAAPVRHVLVIAAQCAAMRPLTRLEEAAEKLHDTLTDPLLGACQARTGTHPSLLCGKDLSPTDVEEAVDQALQRAKEDGAVLVLALLGHGFTAPQSTKLYFMVRDSTTQSPRSAVDVGRLVASVAGEPKIDGLIGVVDTCHAGGSVPETGQLVGSVREGRSRLALLTAATADQPARDMNLSLALAGALKRGIPDAGPAVYVDRALADVLRRLVRGQVIGRFEYDQDPFPLEGLWLARNASKGACTWGSEVVGPLGVQDLRESVETWRGARHVPARLTPSEVASLRDFVSSGRPVEDERDPDAREWVEDVVTSLLEALRTKKFLNDVLADSLSSELLRAAGRLAGFPSATQETAVPLRDLLEYAVLRTRRRREARWKGLARLVAGLFHQAGLPQTHRRLQEWARELDVVTEVNDAFAEYTDGRQRQDLRLVVSLAGAWTGWPEEVDAWLLRGGAVLPLHQQFRCGPGGSHGVAKAIGDALDWARRELPRPELLETIDIAAPAHLLAHWRPEEEKVGRYLLGAKYRVMPRWSGSLDEAEGNAEINDAARRTLTKLKTSSCATETVKWVSTAALRDRSELEYGLATGQFDMAVGVDHCPEDLEGALELFLPFTPIVLWPRGDAEAAEGRLAELVQERWHELPEGLPAAYRSRWGAHRDCGGCLGDVRVVWHDEVWLDFCRPFEHRVVTSPEEEA
ncbi:vWA-MoxR associated conflict system protein [Streptomyces sp. NPDC055099]